MKEIKNQSVERNLSLSHSRVGNVEGVDKHRQEIIIQYHQIEQIIESHLIKYNDLIYETEEDLQTFPEVLHLKNNPISYGEFMHIYERLIQALGC